MLHKCHKFVLSDDMVCILKLLPTYTFTDLVLFLILAEEAIEERSRSKKRAKGNGCERGKIETKPEETKEEDKEASRSRGT